MDPPNQPVCSHHILPIMPMQCTRLRTYRQSYGEKCTYYLLVRWLTEWRQVDSGGAGQGRE